MAVTMITTFDATPEEYDQVNDKLDVENNPPDGFIIHTGAEVDGKIRVIDVWESADAFGKFAEERLGPAVAEVMGDGGPPIEPEFTELRTVIRA
jgi:hypothetical protein